MEHITDYINWVGEKTAKYILNKYKIEIFDFLIPTV